MSVSSLNFAVARVCSRNRIITFTYYYRQKFPSFEAVSYISFVRLYNDTTMSSVNVDIDIYHVSLSNLSVKRRLLNYFGDQAH